MAPERLIGNKPNQVPINGMLGPLAFLSAPVHSGSGTPGVRPENKDVAPGEIWLNRGDGHAYTRVGNSIISISGVYRWGEVPIGRRTIGEPGGIDFGIADPPFTYEQVDLINSLFDKRLATQELGDTGQTPVTLLASMLESQQMQHHGAFSIGTPGQIPFGVGPVAPPGAAFGGLGPDAYNPIHYSSGSFC